MWTSLRTFICGEDGATAVEYAVMLALILIALIAGLFSASAGTERWWTNIDTEFGNHGM